MADAEGPTEEWDDISSLSPEDQELVRLARADFDRIQSLPPDAVGGIAREKQADPIGMRPDGTLNEVERPSQGED
jgi:hypothetical protein